MSQTILAVAAILVFSIFALNQHRAHASAERTAMGSEIELAATDVAREALIEATSLAFDEALVGQMVFQADPDDLTRFRDFGPGEEAGAPADDVDDLHGTSAAETTLRDGQAGRATAFTVAYTVRYVVADDPGTTSPGNQPTLAKEVAVTVTENVAGETGRPPVRCTLAQVITPAWRTLHG